MKLQRAIVLLAVIVLSATGRATTNYSFLGDVIRMNRELMGISVVCEDSVVVRIEFLLAQMLRVTLERSDYREPLLICALAEDSWDKVPLEIAESETAYMVKSSALDVEISKAPCRITVRDKQGRILNQDEPAMGMGWEGSEVRAWKTITPEEKFFGLGIKVGDVNKRGREWVMWNSDLPGYDWKIDPLYQSIPFFMGIRGGQAYGIYFNNSYRTRFNMGAGNFRYYSFSAEQGALDYFFIAGPKFSDVIERYTELTGRMPLPPLWSLGYQQCRWSYYPDKEVLALAQTFRDKKIPADVIYLDIHHMDGYRVFTWDPQRFSDPAVMLGQLSEMGFKVVTIVDPGVKVDTTYRVAREGLSGNHFVHYPDGETYVGEVWPGRSYFPDFSKPEARVWWGGLVGEWLMGGVSGIWNDMNEPSVWGQAFPTETVFNDDGRITSHKKIHNLYGLLMAQATYEGALCALPNRRPFILTRAGFAGEQRYTSVWTGDNVANEEHLALGIRMIQSQSLSGVPFVGTDVGGFIGTPSPELFARWIQVGALSPLFRTHTEYGSSEQEPWSFGENIEEISRKFISLRYQLLPYFYSLFYQASKSGAPLWRPMFWSDQDDERTYEYAYQHQFLVGDHLLAAPVTKIGQNFQKVYLPRGSWLDWNTEQKYSGNSTVIVDAPLDRLPLLLREGAIIPSQDVMQYTNEKPIDRLFVDIFPSERESHFEFYEDDGESFDYQKGNYRLTVWSCRLSGTVIEFSQSRAHDNYYVARRDLVLRVHAVATPPVDVLVDGRPLLGGLQYDEQKKLVTVTLHDDRSERKVIIRLPS